MRLRTFRQTMNNHNNNRCTQHKLPARRPFIYQRIQLHTPTHLLMQVNTSCRRNLLHFCNIVFICFLISCVQGSVIDESAAIPSTKGPLDAYKLLSNRHRDDVRNKYKYVQSSNVTKILGEWWSECSADCKRQHRELAKDMKAEHERNRSSSANEIKAPERAGGSIKHQQSPDLRDRVKRFVPVSPDNQFHWTTIILIVKS